MLGNLFAGIGDGGKRYSKLNEGEYENDDDEYDDEVDYYDEEEDKEEDKQIPSK
jgi:hypothetical protein